MTKLILSYNDINLYDYDVKLFNQGQWLNDICINFCFSCITTLNSSKISMNQILLMDASVVSFLRIQCEGDEEYKELYESLSLELKEWIFIPLNNARSFDEECHHWSLILLRSQTCTLYHFDSFGTSNYASAESMKVKLSKLMKK